jgi:DNA-binding beta-propeller fold protein YncE
VAGEGGTEREASGRRNLAPRAASEARGGGRGEPEIGSTLAGYRLDALIARGGMGVVYRAIHLALDRPVALKVIARHLSSDDRFRDRFLRESRLAASLEHPNVVPVYDAREEDGELIVAMKLVGGGDLKRRIAAAPLAPEEAIDLLGQIAEALDAAHAAGIVHRDVKPHNILLEGDHAYLSDFGLAKALGDSGAQTGASIVGTVEYMSPEQWRGRHVGPAADVYSLGCVLYESLTGIVPFARQAGDAEPEMPAGLDAVIERSVSSDPADRYPSAGALIEAARGRQGATPTTTRVLSDGPGAPTRALPPDGVEAGPRRGRLRRLSWGWLVTPAVLAALVATLLLLLGGSEVSVSSPVKVGKPPLRLAAGEGAVWVTSAADGTLTRIDPDSRKIVGRPLRLGRGISGVAVGRKSVWVSSPDTASVLRIDPAADRVVGRIRVGGRPGAIIVTGGRVWVADERGAGVTAINPEGERVFRRGIAPRSSPLRLAAGAGGVWVSSASTGSVRRIEPGTAKAAGPSIRAGRGPAGITVGGGLVWVANSRSDTVTRVDPSIQGILGDPIPVGGRPGGIDAGTNLVWVASAADDSVSRIDIENGDVVGDPIGVGPEPGAITIGEEAVWVANNGDGTVTRIEP